MTNNKTTKRALLSSAIALFLCFVMLIGTTFAWFTDEATSANNKIQAGKLDVQLFLHEAGQTPVDISASQAPIFGAADSLTANGDSSDTLWEPGKVQTVYLSIKNNGTLDLKYQVAIVVSNITKNLNEVVEYIITPDATVDAPVAKADLDWDNANSVVDGINVATAGDTPLTTGSEHFFALSVRMDPEAGNEYMEGSITFDLKVIAAQLASESDSYDNQYDALAQYPAVGQGSSSATTGLGYRELVVYNDINAHPTTGEKAKLATFRIDEDSVVNGDQDVVISVVETKENNSGITVQEGEYTKNYEITATNLDPSNTEDIVVWLRVGAGLNVTALYHHNNPIDFTYDANSGNIRFVTKSFSPFTVVLSEEPAPEGTTNLPTATITNITDSAPEGAYNWAFGGMDFQNAGIIYTLTPEDLPKLDVLYEFVANQTPEEAAASEYALWNCDYYVMVDKDIAAESIALGGYYKDFDAWLSFTNLQAVPGNEWIPLLGLVSGGWTYQDIVAGVGTFLCGVADYDGSLGANGVTFTVQLRLTNPENADDYVVASEISYAFPEVASSSTELQDSISSGDTEITLGAGEFSMPDTAKGKTLVLNGKNGTVLNVVDSGAAEGDIDYSLEGSDVVFNNMTIKLEGSNYPGYARINSAVYNNCTIEGANFCLYGDTVFNNCTFNITNGYVWTWGAANVEFNNCTFEAPDGSAKAILVHNTVETTVIVNNCTFKGTVSKTTWDSIPVAAVSIDPENGSPDATVKFVGNNTYSDAYHGLYQVKYADELDDVKVYVDGALVEVPVGENDK